jgi:hypothetical protein
VAIRDIMELIRLGLAAIAMVGICWHYGIPIGIGEVEAGAGAEAACGAAVILCANLF